MSLLWMSQRNANAGRSLPEIFKSSFAMFCRFWGTNYTHTHTHTHMHTHTMEEWQMKITDLSASNTKTWYFNLTTNSCFLFHCFVSPDQHFKGLIWVEGICNILLWGSESHQECIWLTQKTDFLLAPKWWAFIMQRACPWREHSLHTEREKVGQVGRLDMICVHFLNLSFYGYTLNSLFSRSVIGLQAVSHYCD